jgi:hypothetical protein
MNPQKTQHFNYAFEAIPFLFHRETDQFFKILERDGKKFLKFWWDHVGARLPDEQLSSFTGFNFKTEKELPRKTTIVWITLPPPQNPGEAYFLALVGRPEKRIFFVRLPTTEIYVLAKSDVPDSEETVLGQLTPRARFIPRGAGPKPEMKAFKETVLQLLKF